MKLMKLVVFKPGVSLVRSSTEQGGGGWLSAKSQSTHGVHDQVYPQHHHLLYIHTYNLVLYTYIKYTHTYINTYTYRVQWWLVPSDGGHKGQG